MPALDRNRRAELLAAADRAPLLATAEGCLRDCPDPELIVGPEVGTLVLTVREPVEATRVHLGDVLVTRTEVSHRDVRGWAMRMGDDRAGALAAAICDAETEAGGPSASLVDELCRSTADIEARARAQEWAELSPTIVDFQEMEL